MTTTSMTDHRRRDDCTQVVLGVDTHKDVHVAAVTDVLGRRLGTASFPTTESGYGQLLAWAGAFGVLSQAGIEGTGSYGVSVSRFLRARGVEIIEVNRPDRAARRRRGKSDPVDAEAAAHAVISGRASAVPKTADGSVEQIRVYKVAKDSAVKAKRQAVNQLHALVVNAEPALREALADLGRKALVTRCAALDDTAHIGAAGAVVHTLRVLAQRVQALDVELADLNARIQQLVEATAPALLHEYGVGVDSAATLLRTVGDNPERLRSESAFAALCGVSPVEMSSGRTRRHRLNRGGDRRLNRALSSIALTRMSHDPATRNYVTRRRAEGRTTKEIRRSLKRYIVRQLYRRLTNPPAHALTT